MELKIHRWIYFGFIISFFFVMVIGPHLGGPMILFEILILFDLPNALKHKDLLEFVPFLLLVVGQLLFLFLGFNNVKKYKLTLLLLSPLCIVIPLIMFLISKGKYWTETFLSMIPFFSMTIVFYIHSFLKLKQNATLNSANYG